MEPFALAIHNNHHDLDRLGLFAEMPYLLGVYTPPITGSTNEYKGAQMLNEYPKTKCGTMEGYFDKKFNRIFTGEAYYSQFYADAAERRKRKQFMLDGQLYPSAPGKLHACPGDYCGNFTKYTAFSPLDRPKPKPERPLPNCATNPGKKGGPGYIDITLNKYPEYRGTPFAASKEISKNLYAKHMKGMLGGPFHSTIYSGRYFGPDPYLVSEDEIGPTYTTPGKKKKKDILRPFMPTGPAKWDGGCKAGGFEPFPQCSNPDPYEPEQRKKPMYKFKNQGPFYPTPPTKSMFTTSVVNHNIKFRVNNRNRNSVNLVVYK